MLKKYAVSLLLAALFCSGMMLSAAESEAFKISASGKAEKEVKADTARVIIYLSADGILMVDAEKTFLEKYAKLENALKEKYKDLEIEQKVISIGQKRSNNYNPDSQTKPQPEIRKQLTITIPADGRLASEIIDAAIRNGATLTADPQVYYGGQVNSAVIYGLKDSAKIEKEIKDLALANMKKNAGELAAIAGKKLGKMTSISISGMPMQPVYYPNNSPNVNLKYTAIEPDKVKVSTVINGTFILED